MTTALALLVLLLLLAGVWALLERNHRRALGAAGHDDAFARDRDGQRVLYDLTSCATR